MKELAISRFATDASNRLRVYVRVPFGSEEFVYRHASSVRWDRHEQCFYCLPVDAWTIVEEFLHIREAVARELGCTLTIDHLTRLDLPSVAASELMQRIDFNVRL